jgi:hypothetical protein
MYGYAHFLNYIPEIYKSKLFSCLSPHLMNRIKRENKGRSHVLTSSAEENILETTKQTEMIDAVGTP